MTAHSEPVAVTGAHRYYVDCEFDGHSGPLLSIGIVRGDGRGLHIQTDQVADDLWVIANVMTLMQSDEAQSRQWVPLNEVGPSLKSFIGDDPAPVIIADSPVDIARFCAAISTGADGGWASADYPRMTFEVHNVDCYPTSLEGAVQHNAWWDAMALRHRLASEHTPTPTDAAPVGDTFGALTTALFDLNNTARLSDNPSAVPAARDRAKTLLDWMQRHGVTVVPLRADDAALGDAVDTLKRETGFLYGVRFDELHKAIRVLIARAQSGGVREWQDIASAPKNRTRILVQLKNPLPVEGRTDLDCWHGIPFVASHNGVAPDGFDIGWQFAAPVGQGGFPDNWIAGWQPLPAPPATDEGK